MMHGLFDVRRSILMAAGLLATGCGPIAGEEVSSGSGSGSGSDGSGSSGDTGVTSADTSDTDTPLDCEGSEPIMQTGVDASMPTGFELCASGVIHRVEAVECLAPLPTGSSCTLTGSGCESDADCDAGAYGRCIEDDFFEPFCGCQYGCATDADCDDGYVCACGGDASDYPGSSRCVPADCSTDTQCDGTMCALGSADDGCGMSFRASCLTDHDTCLVDAHCDDFVDCFPQAEGGWQCENFCCCGRPFVVDGSLRTAPVVNREDWCDSITTPNINGLSPATRDRLGEHWLRAAAMEHASVASFAHFCLQLMSLGAPPDLLEETQHAMRDEIDHARRCFALASAYLRAPRGPGRLDTTASNMPTDRRAVLEAVVREACVAETLAAIEAQHALRRAEDPAVRATLARIADDELRHALLGWRTLAWALNEADDAVRHHLMEVFEDAATEAVRCAASLHVEDDADAVAHGLLPTRCRVEAFAASVDEVIRPCARALLRDKRASPTPSLLQPTLTS